MFVAETYIKPDNLFYQTRNLCINHEYVSIYITENIPYVKHTCYVEEEPCQPLAKNCEEYAITLTCCCHKILLITSK